MDVGLLGPLRVGDGRVHVAPRDRVVLGALAVRHGEFVRTDELAEALWADVLPPSWPKVVQGCVMRLRRMLGPTVIETVDGGYRLTLTVDHLDTREFESLTDRGRTLAGEGDPERAATAFARALSLWRGPALPDLDRWPPGRIEAARLEELRRAVEDDLLDCRLRAGDHRAVAVEAEVRVAEQPLRERRWALLALAQYRCGRQGDALRTLHRARQMLAQELGVDPGTELVALEAAILRHDESLAAACEAPAASLDDCPYKGLAPYDVGDRDTFFGRARDVESCLERLATSPVLVVVGPSGSGKSSLVRAGLVPALERGGHRVAVFVPGVAPDAAMARAIAATDGSPILVVDQFEEIVTLAVDGDTGRAFCASLARYAEGDAAVVVTLRADHAAVLALDRTFAGLSERGVHLLTPLAGDALREAIEGPAEVAGLRLESGLVDLLLRDAEGEPGALPLLSHALAETWRHRDGRLLTVEGYRATGGINGAVARSAERLYQSLTPAARAVLRSILLRLVTTADDGIPARVRVGRHSLAGDPNRERVIDLLVGARLLTVAADTVELAHEALAHAWPRYQSWLDDDRASHRVLRHLTTAAEGWDALGRPSSELYRGARLDAALEWRAASKPELTPLETAFLDDSESQARSEQHVQVERLRQQARQNRRLRTLLSAVAVFLALSLAAGIVAFTQRGRAERAATAARDAERVAEARRLSTLALTVDDLDLSLLLAVEGRRLDDSGDARTNLLSALNRRPQAIRAVRDPVLGKFGGLSVTGDGRYLAVGDVGGVVVFDATTLQRISQPVLDPTPWPAMVPTPDGRGVAVVLAGGVGFFNAETGGTLRPSVDVSQFVGDPRFNPVVAGLTRARSLALSRDGRQLALAIDADNDGGSPGFEVVWDLSVDPVVARRIDSGIAHPGVAFAVDGDLVVFSRDADEASIGVVDANTGVVQATFPNARGPVAVSPDGMTIAASTPAGDVVLLNRSTAARRTLLTGGHPTALAYASDGRSLAVASDDRTITTWDPLSGQRGEVLAGHSAPATSIAFDPLGRTLYSVSPDGEVIVWDLTGDRRLLQQITPPSTGSGGLALVAPDRDGQRLAYLYQDQMGADTFAVRPALASATGPPHTTQHPIATWFDWTPDGRHIVTVGDDRVARLWDPVTGDLVAARTLPLDTDSGSIGWRPGGETMFVGLHAGGVAELDARTLDVVGSPFRFPDGVGNVDVSPDGRMLAVATFGVRRLLLVDHDTRSQLADFEGVDADWRLQFSPDGSLLAAGGNNGVVTLVDPAARKIVGTFVHGIDGPVVSLAFSPDSTRLVTSSTDGTVLLWDIARREQIARFTPGIPGRRVFAWFTPDGRTVVAADERGGVWSVPVDPNEWQRRACAIAGRNLTREEWSGVHPGRAYERTCPELPADN